MGDSDSPRDGSVRLGLMRGFGWLGAAAWWSLKSPAGKSALLLAGLPWFSLSLLNLPTGGIALMATVALYAQISLWSALCAEEHFQGRKVDFGTIAKLWGSMFAQVKGLAIALILVSALALSLTILCVEVSAIGELVEAMKTTPDAKASRALVMLAWDAPGWSGIAWPLAAMQMGLATLNGFWLALPARAATRPESGAVELLWLAWGDFKSAPFQLFCLGLVGAVLAQASLVFPPLGLLAGHWFLACVFARRDLDKQ